MVRGFPETTVTVTDVDDVMERSASQRLRGMSNVSVERADVTGLPFESASFDVVTSYLMLHHVIDWEKAVGEVARTLRQGGLLVGYDLTDTALARLVHRLDGSPHRIISPVELTQGFDAAGLRDVTISLSAYGHVMRFRATK
jgi:ubiquinone/menaquinone biosynthesis C-methylase UbiE